MNETYNEGISVEIVTAKNCINSDNSELAWLFSAVFVLCLAVVSMLVMVLLWRIRRINKKEDTPKPLKAKRRKTTKVKLDDIILPSDTTYEFEKDKIKLEKKIGSGKFGSLYVGTARIVVNSQPAKETTVAVRKCIVGASTDKVSLVENVKNLIHIGFHENIMCLLGLVTMDPTTKELVVLDYCEHGNLENIFISRKYVFVDELDIENDEVVKRPPRPSRDKLIMTARAMDRVEFSTTDLLCWARQVAIGMHYLGRLNFIHRALTTRSVYLCNNNVIKIGDFEYAKSVEKVDGEIFEKELKLPVKTFAPEVYHKNLFSIASDIWAFGILVWEIFSLGKQPYKKLDRTLGLFLNSGQYLKKPKASSEPVYKLIIDCHHNAKEHRHLFANIIRKLKMIEDETMIKYAQLDWSNAKNADNFKLRERRVRSWSDL